MRTSSPKQSRMVATMCTYLDLYSLKTELKIQFFSLTSQTSSAHSHATLAAAILDNNISRTLSSLKKVSLDDNALVLTPLIPPTYQHPSFFSFLSTWDPLLLTRIPNSLSPFSFASPIMETPSLDESNSQHSLCVHLGCQELLELTAHVYRLGPSKI